MHRYCLKTTHVKNVQIFSQYLKPYKVASNAECQQTWYQKNTEKCA